jgi:hypothetical protein
MRPGINFVEVVVQGFGGLLNAWMDFNGDGQWHPTEHVFDDLDLTPGVHVLAYNAPILPAEGAPVAARFRWGEAGLGFTGASSFAGEVEDYLLTTSVPVGLAGDFDRNGIVEQADRVVWRSTFGSTVDLRADGNGDGVINTADITIWRDNLGATQASGGVALASAAYIDNGESNEGISPSSSLISQDRLAAATPLAGVSTSLPIANFTMGISAIPSHDSRADAAPPLFKANASPVAAARDHHRLLEYAFKELDSSFKADDTFVFVERESGSPDSGSDEAIEAVDLALTALLGDLLY